MEKLSEEKIIGIVELYEKYHKYEFVSLDEMVMMASELLGLRQKARGIKAADRLPETIDGVASVIAHAPHIGVFPAQYNDETRRFWYDIESETEIHGVDIWWEYPESEEK